MTTDNVTRLPGLADLPDNPLMLAPRPLGFCNHDAVVLDEHHRTVTCANPKCGAVLDPFNFLRSNAATIQRAWDSHRHVTREVNDLVERVAALKKEEQRLRAMVKRLQEKSGAVLVTRGREAP